VVERFDLAVLGGGMGAWTATQAARRLGARVALFEPGHLGGT